MAKYQAECIQLLQNAINLLHASQQWENRAQVRAQSLGLQAEKREERIEQRKELNLMQYLQSVANDAFDGAEIYPAAGNVTFPQVTQIPDYFKAYLAKLWETYYALHDIANELVVKDYKPIAEPIYEYICCLWDEIIDTRRMVKESALDGWSYHHVSRLQVSAENKHDRLEKLERKTGYKY